MTIWDEKTDKKKESSKIFIILSILFLLCTISAFSLTIFSLIQKAPTFYLNPEYWAFIATCCLIALYVTNIYRVKKREEKVFIQKVEQQKEMDTVQADSGHMRMDFERFKRECLNAFKVHLKISILFWIHYYKKEKARSFEETRGEIFKDLKKQYSQVPWMEEILEDLSKEIAKYKSQNGSKPKTPSK